MNIQKIFFIFVALCSCVAKKESVYFNKDLFQAQNMWKTVSIQHQGRVKPFDTFAREILRTVYGQEDYKNHLAVEVLLSWLAIPNFWETTELILVEKDVKESLGFSLKQNHFSPLELKNNTRLALQLVELKSLKQMEEPLDLYFQNLEKLETRLILYFAVQSGFLIRLEPSTSNGTWLSLNEMTKPVNQQFQKLLLSYIRLISKNKDESFSSKDRLFPQDEKFRPAHFQSFKKNMEMFQMLVFKNTQSPLKIRTEVFYNSFQPFQQAWIFYLLFLMAVLGLSIFKKWEWFKWLLPLLAVAFACHSLGLILRSYIMARPPVSNMYETVVGVPWMAVLAGFVFYLRGFKVPFIASVILAFFCLLLTHLAPGILDSSLQPLEAVLRSSFWLSTHVLMITMSYSFFFLAFVLGDMALISYLCRKTNSLFWVKKLYLPIYRCVQWGVVLLAGGTILGGIWADYSWGRFWGWDPKESWALVSLLAYLALLHGRLIGWIKPFGMALAVVLLFFFVIMAWYGVNFILGAGLHSYGFGSGGVEYVAGFLFVHLILCFLAGVRYFKSS